MNYAWLFLVALIAIIGLWMVDFNPEQAGRIDQAHRDAAFTGDARTLALLALAVGIGGFIAYLTFTRR